MKTQLLLQKSFNCISILGLSKELHFFFSLHFSCIFVVVFCCYFFRFRSLKALMGLKLSILPVTLINFYTKMFYIEHEGIRNESEFNSMFSILPHYLFSKFSFLYGIFSYIFQNDLETPFENWFT